MEYHLPLLAMSEEQLAALFAKLKDDAGLQEKLKGAADLDGAVAMAKDAGFNVSKADWLRYQAIQTLPHELSDEELEGVVGGFPAEFPGLKLLANLDRQKLNAGFDGKLLAGHLEFGGW
jgi:predicted ribosomally synthesized peptide with nif11-like leader